MTEVAIAACWQACSDAINHHAQQLVLLMAEWPAANSLAIISSSSRIKGDSIRVPSGMQILGIWSRAGPGDSPWVRKSQTILVPVRTTYVLVLWNGAVSGVFWATAPCRPRSRSTEDLRMRMVFTDTQYGTRLPPYVDEYPYPYRTAPWLGYSQRYIHTLSLPLSFSLTLASAAVSPLGQMSLSHHQHSPWPPTQSP